MPNHCRNTITIQASPELIDTIVNNNFSFEKLFPLENYSIETCTEYWGTKWDCWNFEVIKRGKDGIIFDCTTAWSPPTKVFDMLIQKCDAWIKCEWWEEGGMAGVIVGDKKELKELMWEDMCIEALAEMS